MSLLLRFAILLGSQAWIKDCLKPVNLITKVMGGYLIMFANLCFKFGSMVRFIVVLRFC